MTPLRTADITDTIFARTYWYRPYKPPPTPKFETKVIRDSNSDFRINRDQDVRRIRPKIVDALSPRRQSFRQVWYKSAVDCMRIVKTEKC